MYFFVKTCQTWGLSAEVCFPSNLTLCHCSSRRELPLELGRLLYLTDLSVPVRMLLRSFAPRSVLRACFVPLSAYLREYDEPATGKIFWVGASTIPLCTSSSICLSVLADISAKIMLGIAFHSIVLTIFFVVPFEVRTNLY